MAPPKPAQASRIQVQPRYSHLITGPTAGPKRVNGRHTESTAAARGPCRCPRHHCACRCCRRRARRRRAACAWRAACGRRFAPFLEEPALHLVHSRPVRPLARRAAVARCQAAAACAAPRKQPAAARALLRALPLAAADARRSSRRCGRIAAAAAAAQLDRQVNVVQVFAPAVVVDASCQVCNLGALKPRLPGV